MVLLLLLLMMMMMEYSILCYCVFLSFFLVGPLLSNLYKFRALLLHLDSFSYTNTHTHTHDTRSNTHTHTKDTLSNTHTHLVGLLWTSDQPVSETST
jgi:hypothetical protein